MDRRKQQATARDRWIEAGLARIAAGGIDHVRIEVLARDLGVTKGGFYWHFADRDALLAAILAHWRDGRAAAIERQASEAGGAQERLTGLIDLYSQGVNPEGMAIELAIRQWARRSGEAAKAVAAVDAARLRSVRRLYEETGVAHEEAIGDAFLFYCFVFGQSLLFLEGSDRARRALISAAAARVTRRKQPSRKARPS